MSEFNATLNFKDPKAKSALSTRWAQMSKQEQIIEKKKIEIQNKLEAQKQAAALAAQAKLANPTSQDDKGSKNIFSNDGSFMSQFKALLEKQKKDQEEKANLEVKQEEKNSENAESETEVSTNVEETKKENNNSEQELPDSKTSDVRSREKQRKWGDRGQNKILNSNSPVVDEKKHNSIPPLMQISVQNPNEESEMNNQWKRQEYCGDDSRQGLNAPNMGPNFMMNPAGFPMPPMPPGGSNMPPMHPNMPPMFSGRPNMPPGSPNMPPMPPFMGGPPMPPNFMGPNGPMPPNMCGPNGPMPPNMCGPNGPMPPNMCGPNGPMPPNMCGPNGPMPPFYGPPFPMGPNGPNSMMPPNQPPNNMPPNGPPNSMMGPNIPPISMRGPIGPPNSMMNPMGPPNSMMGPNGPPNSMIGPNGPSNSMMGPNGPPNMMGPMGPSNNLMGPNGPTNSMLNSNNSSNSVSSDGPPNSMMPSTIPPTTMMPPMPPNIMMPPNGKNNSNSGNCNMPLMGPSPPFGPNGPTFGKNNECPPTSFMPVVSSSSMSESTPLDTIPPPDPITVQNIPPPVPVSLNTIPKPKDMEPENITAPSGTSKVLSPDMFPPPVHQAATEVARNGDHWENVLKAIHSQDQNLWFLHNCNSNEYKMFRELVKRYRTQFESEKKSEIKPEDRYEPEFSLEDDDSYDGKPVKTEPHDERYNYSNQQLKREASSQSDEDSDTKRERRKRKKKSRWGNDPPVADIKPPVIGIPGLPGIPMPGMAGQPDGLPDVPMSKMIGPPGLMPGQPPLPGVKLAKIDEDGLKLIKMQRNNPALLQYAVTNYGSTNLSDEDWKKCEDNFKLNLLYQDMMKKRQEVERLAAAGKHKYEYDSDEDTSEGTWEHKLRAKEMCATEKWATELTKQAAGKHHIGDFLPPEELKKFMEKYSAIKSGKEPDISDYKEFKLKEDNVGFKMLQKLGWTEGQGLGSDGSGIVEPINKANQPMANLGLGAASADNVEPEDDQFDAYRKRMMLAYRFRPNPLNNPRRPYY